MTDIPEVPCPFCGKLNGDDNHPTCVTYNSLTRKRYVQCGNCGSAGPETPSWDEAWLLWNNRVGDHFI